MIGIFIISFNINIRKLGESPFKKSVKSNLKLNFAAYMTIAAFGYFILISILLVAYFKFLYYFFLNCCEYFIQTF